MSIYRRGRTDRSVVRASLAIVLGAAVAAMFASSGVAFGQTTVNEYQITNDLADQFDPAVRGGKVAFTDMSIAANAPDIVVIDLNPVDLNAGPPYAQERVQPTAGAQQFEDIDGNIVVFMNGTFFDPYGGSSDYEILYYDLGTHTYTQVTNDTFLQANPAISGNTIVWEDFRSGSSDIYYFTIGVSAEPAPVTTEAGPQVAPAISGTWVVWQDSATGGDIRGRDLADPTNTIVTIASSATVQLITPDISGLNVTYAQQQAVGSSNFDIYVTAIGGATTAITTDPADQRHPRISGTRIVWEDSRNEATNGIDLYGFDLANPAAGAQPLPVVAPEANQFLADIGGDDVAFTDNRNGNLDIYVLRTTTVVPPNTLTLTPADATNPVGTSHTVMATVTDPVSGVTVSFSVTGSVTASGSCTTNASGQCDFTYTGPSLPGADLISAYADTDGDSVQDADEPSATATKAWVLPTSTAGQASGGGHIQDASWGKVAFGFSAKSEDGTFKGRCNVIDPGNRMIKCLDVTAFVISGNEATIHGNATDNGVATTYVMTVADNADPGMGVDTFSITAASGYSAIGTLTAGNIQVKP